MTTALTYHEQFSDAELDAQYNLRAGRPDYEQTVIPDWLTRSEQARSSLSCRLDLRYGDGEKQKLDCFYCENPGAPTLVYFHGGYWQRGDKSIYSFLATPFVQSGVNVVLVGYDLCPNVTITQISEQARQAISYLWRNSGELNLDRHKINVMGHSAGGQITQMIMATDWPIFADDLPSELVVSGIPISPLSYLEPVRLTQALNTGIRMDQHEAHTQSPMTSHPPATNAPQIVIVGGAETAEFHRQAQMYVDEYTTEDRSIELLVVPNVDHFDELNVLSDNNSPCFQTVRNLIS
ncbi:MAG: alpha/beta hydrolase [Gammaproteobacteria bacterium]|nr:alpha/beta hydrolase [Gammaproteobacteria bacterium]